MAKVDLHVHSKYSDSPSTWGHKVYNSPESFTEIDTVYHQAKARGMDFVTLTDHDDIRGALELVEKFPDDCFISCEVTSFFPEDDCKCHILVYGISEQQYRDLMQIASNVYQLRDYIAKHDIAYSVAHASYDQDGLLSFDHIEKLVVLFDVFEVINGACGELSNTLLHKYLHSLTPDKIRGLASKHAIKPISLDPWIKGFTGGSDDHCGILIGSAYTKNTSLCSNNTYSNNTRTSNDGKRNNVQHFLQSLRDKNSLAEGLHGRFEVFATGIIKHVHDYRANRDPKYSKSKMSDFLQLFFASEHGNLLKRFKKSQSLRFLKKKNTKTHKALANLLQQIAEDTTTPMEEKIPKAYLAITQLHDEMFRSVINVFSKDLPEGDIFKGFNRLASLFPMSVLVIPFLASMRHQMLKSDIKAQLLEQTNSAKGLSTCGKALWFTDTIDDLNGVSVTLRQIAKHATLDGYNLTLLSCVEQANLNEPLPANTLNFEPIKVVPVPGYTTQTIGFPSLLNVLQKIVEQQPDKIIISTPGPLGLAAMLCAKTLDIPVKAIYHTDFAEQVMRMSNEPSLANAINVLSNQFYHQADQVFVPSEFYINKLAREGLARKSLSLFPRGLDLDLYSPAPALKSKIQEFELSGSFTLLFAGRISADKNLKLLSSIIKLANLEKTGTYNLVVAGDGPDLTSLKEDLSALNNIHFTGRLKPDELVDWYRQSDLLVFPSQTDTFGMVVLEAQACGLPCIVSATGGPKEIIEADATGQIMYRDDVNDWFSTIEYYRTIKSACPDKWLQLRERCSAHIHNKNSWAPLFDAVLGDECRFSSIPLTPDKLSIEPQAA